MDIDKITGIIIGSAIEVHKALGPGLLESSYQECLCYELKQKGLKILPQLGLPLIYKDVRLEIGYRIDIMVARIGLLINFNVLKLTSGIKRLIARQ